MSERKHPEWVYAYCEQHGLMPPQYAEWNGEEWEYSFMVMNEPGNPKEQTVVIDSALDPGLRVSGNLDLLLTEAELASEGMELQNPAIPAEGMKESVVERLESEGLEPAWAVCERVEYPPKPELVIE